MKMGQRRRFAIAVMAGRIGEADDEALPGPNRGIAQRQRPGKGKLVNKPFAGGNRRRANRHFPDAL